jgi:hypothetical protein
MATLNGRLSRVERQRGNGGERQDQIKADAAWVVSRIAALAATSKTVMPSQQDDARWVAFNERFAADTAHLA